MALVLGQLHDLRDPVNTGHELHHALSCFAAEEIQHANTYGAHYGGRQILTLTTAEVGEHVVVLGVQWHPEISGDDALFAAFVAAGQGVPLPAAPGGSASAPTPARFG